MNESAVCPYCSVVAPVRIRTGDRNRRISAEVFNYYDCPECHLIFLQPVPSDLGRYYSGDYYGGALTRRRLERAAHLERYKIEMVKRFVSSGRLLEVGPSYGAFALLAKRAGFDVHTIEIDAECCRFLEDVVGVGVTRSDDPAAEMRRSGEKFDVIVMWHNLEHVPNPRELFMVASESLAPHGRLVVAAPNPEAFQFRVFGRAWTHLDAPRHVALMPTALLERWASRAGMATTYVTTTDHGCRGWNEFGWRESLAAGSNNRFARIALRIAGSLVSLLAMPVERTGRRGATYTIVMTREP